MVAERLGDVYEAALAELRVKGSLGRVSGVVVRADVLTPDLFKAIRNHLVAKDMAWATLRENTHESNVTYGIDKYDEARKEYLARPTQIGSLGDDGPTFTRLWYLIDWWLELTTDGNPVLDLDNGTLIHVADLDAAPVTTPVSTFADGADFQDQQNINVVNDSDVFDLTLLYESLKADTWDTFARENSLADLDPNPVPTTVSTLSSGAGARDQPSIKVTNDSNVFDFASIYESLHADAWDTVARENSEIVQRIRQLENEIDALHPQLKCLRAKLVSIREARMRGWTQVLQRYNEQQHQEGKAVFGPQAMAKFLRYVEQHEEEENM